MYYTLLKNKNLVLLEILLYVLSFDFIYIKDFNII